MSLEESIIESDKTSSVINKTGIPTRYLNLERLQKAVAFSLFRDLHLHEPTNKKHVKSDYKVYDLNNRVIFYVSSTTRMIIAKDAPFCLKVLNKDQKFVAKFLRNEPRRYRQHGGLASIFGCCQSFKDEMDVLDDNGNLLAKSYVYDDQFHGTEILMRDTNDEIVIKVRNSKEQNETFFALDGSNHFLGEIRQKIISSGNATDNYKGVSCWFSPEVPINTKLLFLAAAFLIEIDYFSDTIGRQAPFHQPDMDYLNPIIKTPPYHERYKNVTKTTKKNKKVRKPKTDKVEPSNSKTEKAKNLIMPEIHHIKNFAPIGGDVESTNEATKGEKTEKQETAEDLKPTDAKEEIDMNGMSRENFRNIGRKVLDYLVVQDEQINNTRCTPAVKPGYLKALIPVKPPAKASDVDEILEDYRQLILPGLSHSSHPNFHSYYPAGNVFHCLVADLLGGHIGNSGFSWAANPALSELEVIMMDWLADMMGLPKDFTVTPESSKGGGCIQKSSSDSNLLIMIAARTDMIKRMKKVVPTLTSPEILSRLVAYSSVEAHASIRMAAALAMVKFRALPTDEHFIMSTESLRKAIDNDKRKGLIPFIVCATFGTSGPCSFDNLHDIGPICRENGMWLHVDASYAGSALICPEARALMRGLDWADSFSTTPSKLAIAVCEINCLWVKDKYKIQASSIDSDMAFKGLPTSRRYGALNMWFLIRSFGVENLQNQIREHVRLGQYICEKLQKDSRFEVCNRVVLGVVCFRIKAEDNFNKAILFRLNETGKISLASCHLNGRFVMRLCVNSPKCTEKDLDETYKLICHETLIMKPFQERIEQLTADELEEYVKMPMRQNSADTSKRLGLSSSISHHALHDVNSSFSFK